MAIYPFEFHLAGVPLSLQASQASKERWKETVKSSAKQRAEDAEEFIWLEDISLAATIYYFPTAPMSGDIDNIIKPILDALIGTAYLDDQAIERVIAQKFEPDVSWLFTSPSGQLASALDAIYEFDIPSPIVYIRIDNDLSWRTIT